MSRRQRNSYPASGGGKWHLRRRGLLALAAGAAASLTLPRAAYAQQRERLRRIGVFMPGAAENSEFQDRIAAFLQGLGALGWAVGRNVRIDYRWGAGQADRYAAAAEELVALAPDVILGSGTATVTALKKATRTVPIVFANITDPVGSGLVASLARPGGNATGFIAAEFGLSGKWLELLKEITPRMTRAAVLRDAAIASQVGLLGGLQSVAPSLGVELRPIDLRNEEEVERSVAAFASEPNGGLIVIPGACAILRRDLLIALAAKHRLPAVYGLHSYVTAGGLMSYAADSIEVYRQAAGYVDRILKGEKPADLPVQAPTKYELVINLKTAKALGLDVPAQLLARADEVVE